MSWAEPPSNPIAGASLVVVEMPPSPGYRLSGWGADGKGKAVAEQGSTDGDIGPQGQSVEAQQRRQLGNF